MWKKKRHQYILNLLKEPFRLFIRLKYNFKSYQYKLDDKPHIILSNHLTTLDPIMVSASFNKPVYYIANADLFSSKYGKIINYLVAPIPKNKNVKELGPIKDCLRIVKEGGNIGVFPEGNRSYDGELCYMDSSIAKLVKMLKIDLIIYNIHGGYGIDPRWCYKGRRGRSFGKVKKVITKEEIASLSVEELFEVIKEELSVPQVSSNIKYKNKKSALGLERILYVCPICGKIQTIKTNKNKVLCTNCNLEVIYNEYLEFSSTNKDFQFKYVKDWYKYQVDWVKSFDINTEDVIFKDDLTLYLVPFKKRPQKLLCGTLYMEKDKFIFKNKLETKEFKLCDINEMTVLGKHKLNFYIDDNTYQIKGDKTLNVLKYMHMYYHIKNTLDNNERDFMGI
jgi:1-acyl-sn-glycerol-3-phosphate acyltransferase